ncbi:MAG: hypothetical protein J2P49_01615 [Methylocapsa sp.]|nr:hypothetical protein [Methylocapsa sp.]
MQAEALVQHALPSQDDVAEGLTPAEKEFVAIIRLLLADCMTVECNAAAKEFLETAPTAGAARRRAHALLRLAGAIGDAHPANNRTKSTAKRTVRLSKCA